MKKLKEIFKSSKFKAFIWSMLCSILIVVPFLIIYITCLMQYSYITKGFWISILLFGTVLVLMFPFSSVIYTKLYNNYENIQDSKKEYLDLYVNELLSPTSLGMFIVILLIVLDQLSKITAIQNLTLGEPVIFVKYILNWTLAFNKGAAWSMCSEHTNILAIISLVASIIITYFMKDFNIKKKPLYSLGVAFMLGGTMGNMVDRFLRVDGVIDFIELGFMDFPIFNLADSFLVLGTIALMVSIVFTDIIMVNKEKVKAEGEQND